MKTLYINWYGPYTYADIQNNENINEEIPYDLSGNGLYFIIGKQPYARKYTYYIGKTTTTYKQRYYDENHYIHKLSREQSIYLGKIIQPTQNMDNNIDLAESIYIYFSQYNPHISTENDKKTYYATEKECVIVTKFFKKDGSEYVRLPQEVRIIPEFMEWKSEIKKLYYCTKLDVLNLSDE